MSSETQHTLNPTCPHCGKVDFDWWEFDDLRNDGDATTVECGRCEKPYHIKMSVSVSFCTEKVDHEQ